MTQMRDTERLLREENEKLREVVRRQGEFICSLKCQIRDFLSLGGE